LFRSTGSSATGSQTATPQSTNTAGEASAVDQQAADLQSDIDSHESRNLLALAFYQVVLRTGWIFKTETVIMPAFLDLIAGAGWLRGCLPVLNRFGQSVPPLLFAHRLKSLRRKHWALFGTSLGMSVPFFILAGTWTYLDGQATAWLPWLFLFLYGCFFAMTGLNQLTFGTVQGKLIRTNRRGRLLAVAAVVGTITSILCAVFLLRHWLADPRTGFTYIFLATGVGFALAALTVAAVVEPADNATSGRASMRSAFGGSWDILRDDVSFRRLAVVTTLFSVTMIMFPHYQALGRERLGLSGGDMMLWVIVQNLGLGIVSLAAGPLADRRGNRLTLRLLILTLSIAPAAAIGIVHLDLDVARRWYWVVFMMLGLAPATMRTLMNYTLEISDREHHPRYLSTLGLCLAAPFVFSPLVGLILDHTSFELVFLTGGTLVALGGLLTFRLAEPRHALRDPLQSLSPADEE
jgi:hypothetical protein